MPVEPVNSRRAAQSFPRKETGRTQSDYEMGEHDIGEDIRRFDIQAVYSRRGDLRLLAPAVEHLAMSRNGPLRAFWIMDAAQGQRRPFLFVTYIRSYTRI